MRPRSHEHPSLQGLGWLRASVLGANDGIVSTASLILGVAAAHAAHADIVLSAIAALVAGAMSMATGEYVSVHSQADTEAAALERAKRQLCALNNDLTRLDLDVISPTAGTLAANPADGLQKALETTVVQLGAAVDLPAGTPAGVRNRALAAIDVALRDSGDEAAHLLRPRRLRA